MSGCPNGHNPVTVTYDANGWRQWCGQCGAAMTSGPRVPHPSAGKRVALWVAKALVVGVTAISLIVAASIVAALIVYLLSLLAL